MHFEVLWTSPDLTFNLASLSTRLLTTDELGTGGEYLGLVALGGITPPSLSLLTLLTVNLPVEYLGV